MAAAICGLEYSPKPADRALSNVFLRWAKLAFTTRKKSFSSGISQGGAARIVSFKTLEVTFGCGMKHEGGTSKRGSGSA